MEVLVAVIIIWIINWFVVFRGVKKGIEKANLVMMPLLWLLAIILVVRAVTLPGALDGLEWYLRPDFSKFGDYNIWIAAFGQIFFSLSLAMGIMIAYGSYLPEKSDIANNSFIIGLADSAFSFLIGFAVFGTLGYMAYATQTSVQESRCRWSRSRLHSVPTGFESDSRLSTASRCNLFPYVNSCWTFFFDVTSRVNNLISNGQVQNKQSESC